MSSLLQQQLAETTLSLKNAYPHQPEIGIILGSGLGNLISEIKIEKEINYNVIPHFPVSTVEGHSGRLLFGELSEKRVAVMAGRFHFYEGYTSQQVVYPVRVMKMLGIHTI